jgi:hypothetical protein
MRRREKRKKNSTSKLLLNSWNFANKETLGINNTRNKSTKNRSWNKWRLDKKYKWNKNKTESIKFLLKNRLEKMKKKGGKNQKMHSKNKEEINRGRMRRKKFPKM